MANPADATPGLQPSDSRKRKMIVGVDGSDGAQNALLWALDKSSLLGEVTPVMVFEPSMFPEAMTKPFRSEAGSSPSASEAQLLAALESAGLGADTELAARGRVIEGHPGTQLIDSARDADLLVVGTRGRSSVMSTVLGSVSAYCAGRAPVPVAVIPEEFSADRPLSTIVVGVDGSANAQAALSWAIDHVDAGGTICATGALSIWGYMIGEFEPPLDLMEKQILESVEAAVSQAKGDRYSGPQISIRILRADARVALRDLAEDEADMLVLGARGVTGIPHLILGSVSSALVHHPKVPTVIIPSELNSLLMCTFSLASPGLQGTSTAASFVILT